MIGAILTIVGLFLSLEVFYAEEGLQVHRVVIAVFVLLCGVLATLARMDFDNSQKMAENGGETDA